MSSIEKLLIRGIRSFSPEEPAVIEFYSPVTLIVGHNGAGKTTIIECLKYATTGDLPPNSKGGAFIHDPKLLANESLVKAQVKLKFRNVRGAPMVVTRSIQLSVKNKKSELKTLEGLLVTTDSATGEQISISSRVADLDAEVPLHLGVSRAVLENVIFCHQEESQWPLSEPSVLKKKFDDIFAATRYTKALDILKNLKKQLLADLKVEQQKLELCKSDREKALKLNSNMEASRNKLNHVASRIQGLESHIECCNVRIQQIGEELRGVNAVHGDLDKACHELEMLQASIRELENSGMRIMTESEEQLALMLEQHSQVANTAINEQSQLIWQKDSLGKELSILSCQNTSKQVQLGTLKGSLADYERRWQNFIAKFPQERMSIDSLDLIARKFSDASNTAKSIFTTCEAVFNELNNNFIQQLNMLAVKRATMEDSKKQLRKSADDQRNKLSSVLAQISEIENTDESFEELEARATNELFMINKLINDLSQANYDAQMSHLQRNKRRFEEHAVSLASALSEASKSFDARARLDLKREELGKKTESLNKMLKEIFSEAQHNQITVVAKEPDQIEKIIDGEWREKEKLLRELQEKLSAGRQNQSNIEAKLSHLKDLLERKTTLKSQNESKIKSVLGSDNLETALEDAEDKLQAFYSQQSTQAGSISTFEDFLQKISNDQSCPLCERSFDSRVGFESLVIKLRKIIEQMSQIKLDGESKAELETKVQQLRSLRTSNEEMKRLIKVEIPEVIKTIKETTEESEKLALDLEEWSSELSRISLYEKRLGILKRKTEELNKLAKEIRNIQTQISGMESELMLLSSSGSMSLEELQTKLTENQTRVQSVQNEIEALSQEMRLRQNDLNMKQSRFRDLKEQILRTKMAASEKINLAQQQEQLESELLRLNEEIQRIENELSLLSSRHSALEEEKRAKLNEAQGELQTKKDAFTRATSLVQSFEIELRPFKQDPLFSTNLQNEISLVSEAIGKLEELIENKSKELQEVTNQLNAFNKQASELEVITRQIRDNQRLHEMHRRKSTLDTRVQELQIQVGKSGKNELLNQLQKSQFRHSDLMGERSGLLGEAKQLQDQLNHIELELKEDYPNVEDEYRRQYIKCETAMMAAEDIEKYSRALDSAIMRYHSAKMDEINRIIRELWTGTYQGADIDTVEIRADAETTAANRSYNYRVVMVKGGDRQLDMRGRSSAGQRVLASLIIRLALAETFGLQCGVLALDEPTTNLDRENIEGLAAALAELVRVRRAQSNFQLLIITHDEEFVAMLGRHQCADYYWRIDKDENQHSIIERQSIQTF